MHGRRCCQDARAPAFKPARDLDRGSYDGDRRDQRRPDRHLPLPRQLLALPGLRAAARPAFVSTKGTFARLTVTRAALGGRQQPVDVYLPPGYATHPAERYPVVYLLHGFPGVPASYFRTGRLGVVEDVLLARHLVRPAILVAPFGSTGVFTDKEWANGVRPHERWETYLARDVVRAVDARYRTIPAGWARALVGLSEGG